MEAERLMLNNANHINSSYVIHTQTWDWDPSNSRKESKQAQHPACVQGLRIYRWSTVHMSVFFANIINVETYTSIQSFLLSCG